ncbi:MAG: hypothetical protein Q9166_007300 [cf. Caloplaca sp. 2 TL-2023]
MNPIARQSTPQAIQAVWPGQPLSRPADTPGYTWRLRAIYAPAPVAAAPGRTRLVKQTVAWIAVPTITIPREDYNQILEMRRRDHDAIQYLNEENRRIKSIVQAYEKKVRSHERRVDNKKRKDKELRDAATAMKTHKKRREEQEAKKDEGESKDEED